MPARLPPLNALKAFEAAARHLSVKKAAAEMNVTPAAVSHQIKGLEDFLGIQLFHRRNRTLILTEAGRAGLPKLQEGFESLGDAVRRMRPQRTGDTLTVSVAPSFASCWLMPRMHRFFAAYPGIDVRIFARTRHTASVFEDAGAIVSAWLEDSDAAIFYGRGEFPGLHAEKLLPLTVTPICSPQLCAGEHALRQPGDLRHHLLLHDDTGEFYDREPFWDVWFKAVGMSGFDVGRGPHFSHAVLALEAARDGLGVVATMPELAAADIEAGRLVTPFELHAPLKSAYYLVIADAMDSPPAVAAFRDWLVREAVHEGKAPSPPRNRL